MTQGRLDLTRTIGGLTLRGYQGALIDRTRASLRAHRRTVLQSPTGCHAAGTLIMMADGRSKAVEDIRVGDRLMGPAGSRRVLWLCRGYDALYRITPTKGESFVVNGGHVLSLQSTNEGKGRGRTGREIVHITLDDWLARSAYFRHIHKLRRAPVSLPRCPRPDLDPYVLGLLLGDGSIWRMVEISSEDHEVLSAVADEMARHGLDGFSRDPRVRACRTMRYVRRRGTPKENPVTKILRSIGLRGARAGSKFVPDCYKYTDRETQLAVLAGLLDTDGSLGGSGFDFISKSESLARDVVFLARSAGLAAYVAACIKTCQTGASGTYWRVSISGDTDLIPTRVARKRAPPRRQKKNPRVTGFRVEEIGPGEFYGFELDDDHLYLTGDFTVHHNSGKGVMIAFMMYEAAAKGMGSCFVVHRRELVEQVSKKLREIGAPHGVIAAGRTQTSELVQIATVQTLAKRTHLLVPPKLVIIDECHHAAAASYRKVIEAWPDAYVVGLTATPQRLDGRGLNDLFYDLVLGPTPAELIEQGYLADYVVCRPKVAGPDLSGVQVRGGDYAVNEIAALLDQGAIIGDAVDHYQRLVAPKTCLVYTVNRAHARHVEAAYLSAGVNAKYVAGDTPDDVRRTAIDGLRTGAQPVVVSVDLFGEGLDAPGLAAIQQLRPTQSLTLYLQMCGRSLRPEAGKDHAIILDHVGNYTRHGFPDDEREWTLEGTRKRKKKGPTAIALRNCPPPCFAVYAASKPRCPLCGASPEVARRDNPQQVDGELEAITPEQRKAMMAAKKHDVSMSLRAAKSLKDMVLVAMRHGYKAKWAAQQWGLRTGDTHPANFGRAAKIWRQEAEASGIT